MVDTLDHRGAVLFQGCYISTVSLYTQVWRGSPTPPKRPTVGLPRSGDLRSAAWLGQRPATTEFQQFLCTLKFGGSPTPPKRPTVGLPRSGDLRSAAWLGQRPATTEFQQFLCTLKFGAGLPPPPKRPTVGLPRSGDLRSAAWLGQRPATTAVLILWRVVVFEGCYISTVSLYPAGVCGKATPLGRVPRVCRPPVELGGGLRRPIP